MFDGFIQRCVIGGDGPAVAVPTVAIKDTIDIAGMPTRAGSRALDMAPPATAHADVVQAVLDAGCRIVGKTALHEFAYGMTGVNAWSGTPVNPRFPALIPGGSSSGSAAVVAAGLVDFALGTDTGGSIRLPAACCGVFGLKPTFGRVSRRGVMPAESSLDCVGPMADSLDALVAAMAAMDPTFTPAPAGAGSLVLGTLSVAAEPVILRAVAQAVAASGAVARPVELPSLVAAFNAGLIVINAETWAACGRYLDSGLVGADVAARLAKAAETTPEDVASAEEVRARFTAEVDRALADVDALVLPTLPGFPMPLDEALAGRVDLRASALVRPFNLSGHPALSIPLPPVDGRPVSLQLIGRKGEDAALCAVGQQLVARPANQ
ncbi:MAG TPA: amidase [Azospirillum sp.]|nr:amidase [Azospirillum sp.]